VVTAKPKPGAMPATLAHARELMPRLMPAPTAPRREWLAFRRRSAAIYKHVADVDRGHHHEALYWAELETAVANELEQQIDTGRKDGSDDAR
jgi:hypothetical protein